MSFQLRHKKHGVYQGNLGGQLDVGFWYPLNESPELGYYEFATEDEANSTRHFLLTTSTAPFEDGDLVVEPYNKKESNKLMRKINFMEISKIQFSPAAVAQAKKEMEAILQAVIGIKF